MSVHFASLLRAWRRLVLLVLLAAPAVALAQNATFSSGAAFSSVAASGPSGALDAVRSWIGKVGKPAELLPPDQAFSIAVRAKDANTLIATLTPAADYYMYRDRISFSVVKPGTIKIVDVSLPQGEPKADPTFGTVQVYHQAFDAVIKLRMSRGSEESVDLLATYQGCNEPLGVCYPPIEKTITVSLTGVSTSTAAPPEAAVTARPGSTPAKTSEQDSDRLLFANPMRWALVAAFFGFGVLLAFTSRRLPMIPILTGASSESIKRVSGVTLLAMAVYLVSPMIPLVAQQLLWAVLLVVPAIYLRALDPLPADAPGYTRLFKGIGVMALLLGAAMLVGALSGHREILQPLAGLRGTERVEKRELPFQRVFNVADLDARLQAARGRPVMLDFWAEWCVSCKEMDQFTFSDPRVQARLQETLILRADVTANNADDQALMRRFSLFGPPGIIFFDRTGKEVAFRVIGYQPPEQFLRSLDQAAIPQPPQ